MSGASPIDQELCEAVWVVVDEVRGRFREFKAAGIHLPLDFEPEEIRYFDQSGFPDITRGFSTDQLDFRRCFDLEDKDGGGAATNELESVRRLTELAEGHDRLRDSFLVKTPPDPSDPGRHFFDFDVQDIPRTIFDRLMRVVGEDFDRDQFLSIYCEIESGRLRDELPIAIAVPIALTHFEIETFQLSESEGVIAMPEPMQLARHPSKYAFSNPAPDIVVGAATHALVLTTYTMTNPSGMPYPPYGEVGWYPTPLIERFFDALRVVTGLDTGYAQICLIPQGKWALGFQRELPPILQGPVVRRYPAAFDKFGWLAEREAVTEDQLREVGELFRLFAKNQSVHLSASRLSSAMLHDDDDDRILDLLIGLEAALGDGSKGEMTYKLAMRTAATLSAAGHGEPGQIFGNVKRLYDYRSAVAHGSRKRAEKRRLLEVAGEQVPATDIATDYLRQVIRVLASRGDITGGGDVDSKLIFQRLGGGVRSGDPSPENLGSTQVESSKGL